MLVSRVTHSNGVELYLCSESSFFSVSIFHCHRIEHRLQRMATPPAATMSKCVTKSLSLACQLPRLSSLGKCCRRGPAC